MENYYRIKIKTDYNLKFSSTYKEQIKLICNKYRVKLNDYYNNEMTILKVSKCELKEIINELIDIHNDDKNINISFFEWQSWFYN